MMDSLVRSAVSSDASTATPTAGAEFTEVFVVNQSTSPVGLEAPLLRPCWTVPVSTPEPETLPRHIIGRRFHSQDYAANGLGRGIWLMLPSCVA
jgi:hypothetical protein